MSNSTFPGLSTAEQIFKDLVWTPMITSGEAALIAAEGPIGAVLGTIEKSVLNDISDALFMQLCLVIDIEAVQMVSAQAASAYADSSLRLKVVVQESGVQSVAYQSALAAERQALSAFTQFHAA